MLTVETWKKTAIFASLAFLLLAGGLWFFGKPYYREHKEKKFAASARRFLESGDVANSSLAARQALTLNPSNLQACKVMAELAQAAQSPQALDWWRRVVELEPSVTNKLFLAAVALKIQAPPFPLTSQTLEEVFGQATNIAAFHVLSAELALRQNEFAQAEGHLEEALRINPENEQNRLGLAALRLQSTNETLSASARQTLVSMSGSTNAGHAATRLLVRDALRREDLGAAEKLAGDLLKLPQAGFEDQLLRLGILARAGSPGLEAELATVLKAASTNANRVYATCMWMVANQRTAAAREWLDSLPASIRAEQPVPLAYVDCYTAQKDWIGLDGFLKEQKWADKEFLRWAFLSRAANEMNENKAAETRWRTAIRETGDKLGALMSLLNMASVWERPQQKEELLWHINQRFPRERWALRELDRIHTKSGDTRGLNKVYAAVCAMDSTNAVALNNYAATSLLLNENMAKAHEMANQAYRLHPDNPTIASTYAFSLHRQGKTSEAVAVLETLKPEALARPPVALYYGLVLAASGQREKAAPYFEKAKVTQMLPEEQELLKEFTN